jgi:hypothetical protein
MPQIDIVTYFPIILWTLLIVSLGFLFFNLYLFLHLVSIMKLSPQWQSLNQRLYWLNWNKEEVVDWQAWTNYVVDKVRNINL